MTSVQDYIYDFVKQLVVKYAKKELTREAIHAGSDTNIWNLIHMPEQRMIDIIYGCQEEFDIEIPDKTADGLNTIDEFVQCIDSLIAESLEDLHKKVAHSQKIVFNVNVFLQGNKYKANVIGYSCLVAESDDYCEVKRLIKAKIEGYLSGAVRFEQSIDVNHVIPLDHHTVEIESAF